MVAEQQNPAGSGSPDDPTVEAEASERERNVRTTGSAADAGAWQRLIEQLRSRNNNFLRYVLRGEVGRGGMGVIQRVYDRDVRRTLAMKIIRNRTAAEHEQSDAADRSIGRFLEEAQVTGQLDHPGIVPVHELGVDSSGQLYFTMKLVEGENLLQVIRRVHDPLDDRWNETRALTVLLRVCEAMAYAHSKGVLHRDLKPANIMVGDYGEAYVMDWGLARVIDRPRREATAPRQAGTQSAMPPEGGRETPTARESQLTRDGDVVGTPAYMSPEQAGGELDLMGPPADVYAVGAMLYHLLAGHMPYARPDTRPDEILDRARLGPPLPIERLRPDVPAELVAICVKAMARDRNDRYPGMDELAADLRAFLENRVVQAYETGPLAQLRKWVVRNQGITLTAAAALLLLTVLTIWFILNLQDKEQEAQRSARAAQRSEWNARQSEQSALAEKARADQNASRAQDEKERADRNAAVALARAREAENNQRMLLRVSDVKRLADLLDEQELLWPAHPDRVAAMEAWLGKAARLLERRAEHRETLDLLRGGGHPMRHPQDDRLDDLTRTLLERGTDDSGSAEALRRERERLARRLDLERSYHFGDDTESTWWHDTLRDLLIGLARLEADDPYGPTLRSVETRLALARALRGESIERFASKWDEALRSIADPRECPAYAGLNLTEQLGLVPIGRDPDSGLWEFWHLPSGERPQRDQDGELLLEEDTGIVLVLIPGGTFRMGSQKHDPDSPGYDPNSTPDEADTSGEPVDVTLEPFFLSKYELSQAQWRRATGDQPSFWTPEHRPGRITPMHPVEQVSWNECTELARRLGLRLPSEARWEYACRAGSSSIWHSGDDPQDLYLFANLRDRAFARIFVHPGICETWNDGQTYHAAIGSFEPNGFGLHDMLGNVWEWCLDGYGRYDQEARSGDGARSVEAGGDRVARGGSFDNLASFARSAHRFGAVAGGQDGNLGVRLARDIDR